MGNYDEQRIVALQNRLNYLNYVLSHISSNNCKYHDFIKERDTISNSLNEYDARTRERKSRTKDLLIKGSVTATLVFLASVLSTSSIGVGFEKAGKGLLSKIIMDK